MPLSINDLVDIARTSLGNASESTVSTKIVSMLLDVDTKNALETSKKFANLVFNVVNTGSSIDWAYEGYTLSDTRSVPVLMNLQTLDILYKEWFANGNTGALVDFIETLDGEQYTGWIPVLTQVNVMGKIVLKLQTFIGGDGDLKAELQNKIGKYKKADGTFTSNLADAVDVSMELKAFIQQNTDTVETLAEEVGANKLAAESAAELATMKAGEATMSANQANTLKNNAQESAITATNKASEAAVSANQANFAKNDAMNAAEVISSLSAKIAFLGNVNSDIQSQFNYKYEILSSVSELQSYNKSSIAILDSSFWVKKSGNKSSNGGLFPGTIIGIDSLSHWERQYDDTIWVEWFGAIAETDCTNAFQNAVNVRQSLSPNGWNRNITGAGNGVYICGNIILPSDGTVTIKGGGLYGMYIKLRDNENKPLFTVPSGDCVPYFENLVLDGNKANQTDSESHGIEYKDAIDSSYRRAGMVTNCNIVSFKGDGIHGGAYKQLLRITNTDIRDNDGHGIYQPLNNADWFVNSGDIGNNGKCNMYISSQIQVVNASIYYAGEHNIYFGTHARWSSVIGNLIDHASQHGIFVEGSATNPCEINISGNRFILNSLGSLNTYSDISLQNTNGVNITNNSFLTVPGQNTGHVKHLVETNNSTKTSFFNNTWNFDSFLTAVTNDTSVLGNQENVSFLGDTRINGNVRSTKNLSFTDAIVGSTVGNILGVNKLVFGSGDPSQTLGGGRIGSNASNNQLQIDYGTAGVVFRSPGNVVGFVVDVQQRAMINTINFYNSVQFGIESTTRGFLPPRMNTAQINAIASPVAGLVVYNTELSKICFYDGTSWQKVTSTPM